MTFRGEKFVAGAKEAKKALALGRAAYLYLAADAAENVIEPLRLLASENGVPVDEEHTMRDLGRAAGIAIGAGAVTILKD